MPTNQRVFKYPLPLLYDWVRIPMPRGAEPLCVQMQDGRPCMWARVDIDEPVVTHHFRVAGTGHDLDDEVGRYIGTIQMHGGDLVLHVFAQEGS